MNPAPQRYFYVLRYVYALAVIAVIAAIGSMFALYKGQQAEIMTHDRVVFHYLASLAVTEQLQKDVGILSRLAEVPGEPMGYGHADPGLSGTLFAIQIHIGQLHELQKQYGGEEFVSTLDRLTDRFGVIQGFLAESKTPDETLETIAVFEMNIEQLYRLHQIAASDVLADFQAGASPLSNLAIPAAILTIAMMLGWYIAGLLRKSLAQQTQTELALAASQERTHHLQKLEALGQLVGGVAHDFNNLLTVILGQTQLLEHQTGGDKNIQQGLDEISRASRQGAWLTRQLLAFSRRQPIEAQPIDLNELIKHMEPLLHRLIGEDIDLEFQLADIRDAVELDPVQMHQVILNLLINARDAMPNGGNISFTTEQVHIGDAGPGDMDSGHYAKISVTDNGVGMNKETLDRLFEPFYTTKRRGRGTGLGLSTVHGIVTAASGYIFVDSTPEEGTCFEIYWPTSERRPKTLTADSVIKLTGSETILAVEDEDPIRKLLRDGLESLGYRVLAAPGGREGLEICGNEPGIDLIISDVVMPDMNGAEFMKDALRMQPAAAAIFISGYTDDIVLQRGIDSSAIPLVNKPFELGELAKIIREQLRNKATSDDARHLDAVS